MWYLGIFRNKFKILFICMNVEDNYFFYFIDISLLFRYGNNKDCIYKKDVII